MFDHDGGAEVDGSALKADKPKSKKKKQDEDDNSQNDGEQQNYESESEIAGGNYFAQDPDEYVGQQDDEDDFGADDE